MNPTDDEEVSMSSGDNAPFPEEMGVPVAMDKEPEVHFANPVQMEADEKPAPMEQDPE